MAEHYKILCSVCGKIIEQCRCYDPRKPTTYGVCADCANKKADEAPKRPPTDEGEVVKDGN